MTRGLVSERAARLEPSIIRDMSRRRRDSSVDLTLGQPSLPPDEGVIERAYARLAREGHGYTENAGLAELRGMVAEHHGLPGRGGPEHVVMAVGSEQGLYLALTAAVDPWDEVLVPEPSFPAYRGICGLVGAVPVPYPVTVESGLVPRVEALEARRSDRTRAVVINDPSNPFGAVIPKDELDRLATWVDRHQLVAVTDEIYRDLRYDGAAPDSLALRTERAILVGGLSKSCALTGHRLGYVIAESDLAARMVLVNQMMVTCAPRPAQYVALEIFSKPELLRAHVPFYEKTRATLREVAEGLPKTAPLHLGDGAFYAVLDVRAHAHDDPLALALELLEAEDVVVVPGTAFGPSGTWFWRMSYAAGPDVAGEGLRRIGRFLSGS